MKKPSLNATMCCGSLRQEARFEEPIDNFECWFTLSFWNFVKMPLDRDTLERQLTSAQDALSACEKQLDEQGVAADKRRRNTRWRSLDSDRRKVINRLNSLSGKEARDEDARQRKAGKDSGSEE